MNVKNDFKTYSRKADLKIQQLREVVGKLQRGEAVDVEKILGTGDETQEREWEEALQELQKEDRIWQSNRQRRREEQEHRAKEEQDANPVNDAQDKIQTVEVLPSISKLSLPRNPGFY